jgi:transketolase
MTRDTSLDALAVSAVKGLVLDATRKASSGHPGGSMSAADFVYVVFKDFLRFDPDDTSWFNRDRFVLSFGHASPLLYSMLCLTGHLEVDQLMDFRQWESITPGHPENGLTPGVEATTGPLGQGMSTAVGLAAAEAHLRARLGQETCSHHTYVAVSDGDLQEPITYGAASLAGLWGLGRLIVLYDANAVQLAGPVAECECTDYARVYGGICWQVIEVDGHDHDEIRRAVEQAREDVNRPSLIVCRTVMAKGSATMEGRHETHGAPLPPEEIAATKTGLGLPADKTFHLPPEVVDHFRAHLPDLRLEAAAWRAALADRLARDTEFARLWETMWHPPSRRSLAWPEFDPETKMATRKAWGQCLMGLVEQMPFLVGGSADLDPSNQTQKFKETVGNFCADHANRNFSFGVREFPMAAIANGLALHGGLTPFTATFLAFADYSRSALRMSALQHVPVLHVFTHDSFHVGEDGPTHQPVEHVSSLRLIPNMNVLRPADANETAACLNLALTSETRPACLCLTRQGLPVLDPALYPAVKDGPRHGGYVLADCEGEPEVIILAAGSEVSLALETAAMLDTLRIRVVSMPCTNIFDEQSAEYKDKVLPPSCTRRVAVEAGASDLWHKYVGRCGLILGMDHFGHSAPAAVLAEKYGFTPRNLAALIQDWL